MAVYIAVLATFDTKGREAEFVGERIAALGTKPLYVDLSLDGSSLPSEEPVHSPGTGDRSLGPEAKRVAMQGVVDNAAAALLPLVKDGSLRGLIGLGGGQGTWLFAEIAKRIPLGIPKVLVTTLATRAGTYLEGSDTIVVPSITDIAGLNGLLREVLRRAAGAVVGAVAVASYRGAPQHAAVTAMTMFGVTTRGGMALKSALEEAGLDVAVFHANGNGGMMLESLIEDRVVASVAEWTTTELVDDLLDGIATAGPDRLRAAGRAGIPQLVVPGALDIANFGRRDSVPERYRGRRLHEHTPAATLMRTNADDMRVLANSMAAKLNASIGPVSVVVPERGFSELSAPGGPFHSAEADAAWIDTMRAELHSSIPFSTHPHNINDPEFAAIAARAFLELLPSTSV
ncbi:Tm-1-like ATP-binding domain-containing protein [Microbacterium esteraromaticum]|nr:Tm-1-like ATP-binding domain-containing protein [Microbacterium esteraromaticum]